MPASLPPQRRTSARQITLALALASAAATSPGLAQEVPADLTEFSLADLTRIEVTSVAKKQQSLAQSAAAVYVVTAEDIRRMGATSLPEALRFVPGVQVARIDAGKWAVSARGFNGRFSNKLLVLIDGRSIYSPLFSGVFWEMYGVPMEHIERIEVIRGAGATMWGANAMNGVINVITKSASETQGGASSVRLGTLDGPVSSLRYGGRAGGGAYRVFTRTQQRRDSPDDSFPVPADDGWRSMQAGFRYEIDLSDRDAIEIHSGSYRMSGAQRSFGPTLAAPHQRIAIEDHETSTDFILGRWNRSISDRNQLSLQAYYDRAGKRDGSAYASHAEVLDFELQHRLRHTDWLELTWGAGRRTIADRVEGGPNLYIAMPRRRFHVHNAFVQEEARLLGESLFVTLGAKLEHNTFGGNALQPTAKLLWSPTEQTSFWAAVSRAARAPSRGESDIRFDVATVPFNGLAGLVRLTPNPNLGYETMTAYEAGFRTARGERWTLDLAVFENRYRNLAGIELLDPALVREPRLHVLVPVRFDNSGASRNRGLEASLKLNVTGKWDLEAVAAWLDSGFRRTGDPLVTGGSQDPSAQHSLRSNWSLRRNLELNLAAGYTRSIAAAGFFLTGQRIPGYVRADARLEWRRSNGMRFSVGVQDALRPSRYEFDPESLSIASPVGRNVYSQLEWGF